MVQRDKPLLHFRLPGILFDHQSQARARMSRPAINRPRASCTVTRFTPAGLSGVSAHGLRKAFAAQLAEQESSTSEIRALSGWVNLKQVVTCTKLARRQKLAENMVSRRQERAEEE